MDETTERLLAEVRRLIDLRREAERRRPEDEPPKRLAIGDRVFGGSPARQRWHATLEAEAALRGQVKSDCERLRIAADGPPPDLLSDIVAFVDAQPAAWLEVCATTETALAARCSDGADRASKPTIDSEEDWALRAMTLAAQHPDWSIGRLANQVGVSRSTFYRKRQCGQRWAKPIDLVKQAQQSARGGRQVHRRAGPDDFEALDD